MYVQKLFLSEVLHYDHIVQRQREGLTQFCNTADRGELH